MLVQGFGGCLLSECFAGPGVECVGDGCEFVCVPSREVDLQAGVDAEWACWAGSLPWSQVSERRSRPGRVVIASLTASAPRPAVAGPSFGRPGDGICPRYNRTACCRFPTPTSNTSNSQVLRRPVESAIAAAVGVEDRMIGEAVVPGGHADGLLDERGLEVIVHRPADHGPGVAADHRGPIEPPLPRRNISDVAHHFLPRVGGSEVTNLSCPIPQALRLSGHQSRRAFCAIASPHPAPGSAPSVRTGARSRSSSRPPPCRS